MYSLPFCLKFPFWIHCFSSKALYCFLKPVWVFLFLTIPQIKPIYSKLENRWKGMNKPAFPGIFQRSPVIHEIMMLSHTRRLASIERVLWLGSISWQQDLSSSWFLIIANSIPLLWRWHGKLQSCWNCKTIFVAAANAVCFMFHSVGLVLTLKPSIICS